MEVEKNQGLTLAMADKAVPAYAWTEEIIKDHLDRDIKEIIVLSPTACMIFKGLRGAKEGFTMNDIPKILDRINGECTWAGKDAVSARSFSCCRTVKCSGTAELNLRPGQPSRPPVPGIL